METSAVNVLILEDSEQECTMPASVLDALSEETLHQLCLCLPGRDLLRFSAAAKPLHDLSSYSPVIWKRLAFSLLGRSICELHQTLAARTDTTTNTSFWRKLFRSGQELRTAWWATKNLRSAFFDAGDEDAAKAKERINEALVGSGHCSVGIGSRVVKLGGLRPNCALDHIHASIFDLRKLSVNDVQLSENSEKPERRMRFAACEIKPPLLSGKASVLVLGGHNDKTRLACKGGLQLLHFLEFLDDTSSLGKWHSVGTSGEAPSSIWHHVCGSFAAGTKVVVSGGDFHRTDPEFVNIEDRSKPAGFVYVLNVVSLSWERVITSGPAPTWRSLHCGFTHCDVSSHAERLVILGGCSAHLACFSSSDDLAPMDGHALDLTDFKWLPPPSNSGALPRPRLRFTADKFGDWLLLYGGHGEEGSIGERAQLNKLNLRTLTWDTLDVFGREGSHSAAPAATMSAGVVLGGVKFSMFGITTVPKLDVLTICDPKEEIITDEENLATSPSSDSEESDEDLAGSVAVMVRDAQGNAQRMVIPRALAELLLARQDRLAGDRGEEEAETD